MKWPTFNPVDLFLHWLGRKIREWFSASDAGKEILEGVDATKPKPPEQVKPPNIFARIFKPRPRVAKPEPVKHIQSPIHPAARPKLGIPPSQRGGNRAK